MKSIEVTSILAIGLCVWFFGGTLVGLPVTLSSALFAATLIGSIGAAIGYVAFVRKHERVAKEKLAAVILRLLLSLIGVGCLYAAGRLVVYFAFYSESDITSGNAQLDILTYVIEALLLVVLWLYGRRIFQIVRQRRIQL